MKFTINIGGLKYNIDSLTNDFYYAYGIPFECPYDDNGYNISVSKNELLAYELYDKNESDFYNEINYVHEQIIKHCLDYNRMIIHGSAICYKENAYLFIAPSGTGKTTHTKLWKQYLGDELQIINGDKPMLEFSDEVIVHGTPWNGKENLGSNISAPLKKIVVLKQAKENSFRKLDSNESLTNMLKNCFFSVDKQYAPKVINYISKIIEQIPIYELSCDISKEAFDVCFENLINK